MSPPLPRIHSLQGFAKYMARKACGVLMLTLPPSAAAIQVSNKTSAGVMCFVKAEAHAPAEEAPATTVEPPKQPGTKVIRKRQDYSVAGAPGAIKKRFSTNIKVVIAVDRIAHATMTAEMASGSPMARMRHVKCVFDTNYGGFKLPVARRPCHSWRGARTYRTPVNLLDFKKIERWARAGMGPLPVSWV